MKRLSLVVLVLAGVALCSCATMNPVIPLPNNILIVSPDLNLPPEIKAFSGKWGGRWWDPNSSGGLDAVLIVEKIDKHQATVVYSWGDSSEWNITKGWKRFEMNVSRNKQGQLVLSSFFSRERKLEVHLERDELEGTLGGSRSTSFITMKRLQITPHARPLQASFLRLAFLF